MYGSQVGNLYSTNITKKVIAISGLAWWQSGTDLRDLKFYYSDGTTTSICNCGSNCTTEKKIDLTGNLVGMSTLWFRNPVEIGQLNTITPEFSVWVDSVA